VLVQIGMRLQLPLDRSFDFLQSVLQRLDYLLQVREHALGDARTTFDFIHVSSAWR
jgi:hypothetical protein